MKSSRKLIILIMVFMLGICLLQTGCNNAAQKPYTPTPQTKNNNPNVTTPSTTDTTTATQVAKRSAAEANKIAGVNKATAVVTGKRIYLGLDMDADISASKSAEIEKMAVDKVKAAESGYTVVATADADTVTRIKNIAAGVAAGKPVSSFAAELKDIDSRLKPTVE